MQLDREQQIALATMLSGKNVFLTGRAGTGKSTVVNEYIRHNPPNLVCAAPTGMAARNLTHAQTLHRCFDLPIGIAFPPLQACTEHSKSDFLRAIKTVLIDEISMVRSDAFMAVDNLLRSYAPSGKQQLPFGGRQLIVVGDFCQLPPVADEILNDYLEERFNGVYAFGTPAWQAAAFYNVELTEIHRQTDREYIDFLNEIRCCGDGLFDRLPYVNQRVRSAAILDINSDATCLCCRNRDAARINEAAMAGLPDSGEMFVGQIQGDFPPDELPVQKYLRLKRGERVMIQANRNFVGLPQEFNYVNGDIGVVQNYNVKTFTATVKLNRGPTVTIRPMIWTNYEYVTWRDEEGKLQIKQKETGTFHQLPLAPAYATSIHKSQGQTLNQVHVVLGRQCFAPGQLYTALSRIRSLADLTLDRPIRIGDAIADAMVLDFINRL